MCSCGGNGRGIEAKALYKGTRNQCSGGREEEVTVALASFEEKLLAKQANCGELLSLLLLYPSRKNCLL